MFFPVPIHLTDLEELQKQLDDIRSALKTLSPGSRTHQKLSEEQAALETQLTGAGAIAQGENAQAVGATRSLVPYAPKWRRPGSARRLRFMVDLIVYRPLSTVARRA